MSENKPIIENSVQKLIEDQRQIRKWVDCFGSPLHLTFPQVGLRNALRWRNAIRNVYPNTDIRFSMKACKSDALVKAFSFAKLGLDVSSSHELIAAFDSYANLNQISFTGPDKPSHDLAMCISHGIAVNIDSSNELDRFLELQDKLGRKGKPILRLRPKEQSDSRFGFSANELLSMAKNLQAAKTPLEGISFHLSGYDSDARIRTSCEAIDIIRKLSLHRIRIKSLNIGGGYLMRYIDKPLDSQTFSPQYYWRNKSIERTYPYTGNNCSEHQVIAILNGILEIPENKNTLLENNIQLIIEPGRALLDQCGGTVFSVIGRKSTGYDAEAIILEGMSFSLSETWFNSDFIPKPVLLTDKPAANSEEKNRFALVGRSCLEQDVIRWHLDQFESCPQTNDLFYFHNTAGYQMDSNESTFHRIPLPRKVSIFFTPDGPSCQLDSEVDIRSFTSV